MKAAGIFILINLIIFLMPVTVSAEEIYENIWDITSPEIRDMFSSFGIDGISAEELMEISPVRIFSMLREIFTGEIISPFRSALMCLALMAAVALINNFLPEKSSFSSMGESTGLMCVMFALISSAGGVFADCCSSLLLSKDFMLGLIPVLTGVAAAAGNPSLAVSINTMVFAFAEGIAVFFADVIPVLAAASAAAACATALNPMMKFSGIGRIIPSAASMLMAFISGIFVSVMSLRGIIAGAADTVAIKGMRFLVGNAVPIVGSAMGEALNSVLAGLGLIKNTAGVFGIAAVALAVLPSLIKTAAWKFSLFFLGIAADMFGFERIKGFTGNLSRIFSIMTAALMFSAFVFIISIAILITVSKGQ